MATYQIVVLETRAVSVTYYVEAASNKEAISKAKAGTTIEEAVGPSYSVVNREVVSAPKVVSAY